MVRKFKKVTNLKTYYPDTELEGHLFSFGRIGAGKSVSTQSIIQSYHDNRGYKLFDIYGGERHEGVYWSIPSNDDIYWKKLEILGGFDEEGPKQYNVTFLYPNFASKLPKKLPKKKPNINSKVFTIPLSDVSIEDIKMVIGNVAETSKYLWNEILHETKRKDNCASLVPLAKKLKGTTSTIYRSFILPMSREKFLMEKGCDYNLDLREEARNLDTITVLCLEYVPEQFHIFVINYILRKLTELIDENKIKKKNLIFIREAASFFRATEDSVVEDRFKIFRSNLAHYLRMGRRGTYFALDCQSSWEVKGLVQGSEDYMLMFKTTSWRDKEEMCDELKRERRMRPDQVADLAFLEKGECYIAETGKVVRKYRVVLPRTMYWKKEYGNFYKNIWEKYGGQWLNTLDIREEINEEYERVKKQYEEKEKTPKKVVIDDSPPLVVVEKPKPPTPSEPTINYLPPMK